MLMNRVVKTKKLNYYIKDDIFCLVKSNYLDEMVNDTRNDFFNMSNNELFINLEDIKIKSIQIIKNCLKEKYNIDLDEKYKDELLEAKEKAPYLSYYLKDNEFGMDKNKLIEKAEKEL